MCGIAGFVGRGDAGDLRRMSAALGVVAAPLLLVVLEVVRAKLKGCALMR